MLNDLVIDHQIVKDHAYHWTHHFRGHHQHCLECHCSIHAPQAQKTCARVVEPELNDGRIALLLAYAPWELP